MKLTDWTSIWRSAYAANCAATWRKYEALYASHPREGEHPSASAAEHVSAEDSMLVADATVRELARWIESEKGVVIGLGDRVAGILSEVIEGADWGSTPRKPPRSNGQLALGHESGPEE